MTTEMAYKQLVFRPRFQSEVQTSSLLHSSDIAMSPCARMSETHRPAADYLQHVPFVTVDLGQISKASQGTKTVAMM